MIEIIEDHKGKIYFSPILECINNQRTSNQTTQYLTQLIHLIIAEKEHLYKLIWDSR